MVLQPNVQPGNRAVVLIHELKLKPVLPLFAATLNGFVCASETCDQSIVTDDFHANSF
jgi:hypothetical protein